MVYNMTYVGKSRTSWLLTAVPLAVQISQSKHPRLFWRDQAVMTTFPGSPSSRQLVPQPPKAKFPIRRIDVCPNQIKPNAKHFKIEIRFVDITTISSFDRNHEIS